MLLQHLMVEAGGKTDKIILSPNNNTLKCILDIKDVNYQIDFAVENSLRRVLGFDAKIYKRGRHESENLVDIMSVDSILVHCDIIGASRVNASPGDKIVSTLNNLIYVPITLNVISYMTCWLTDQSGNELDFCGEELTITLAENVYTGEAEHY